MATISDIYEILSKAQTAGIDKATAAVSKHGNAIARAGKQAAQASAGGFSRILGGIKRLGSLALNVARGALSKLWGALKGIATLGAGILGGALLAMKDGLSGVGEAVGTATEKVKDLASKGGAALKNLAKETKKFVKDAGGFFGAIGKVGAGFVQRARQVVKAPLAIFKGVVKGAKAAGKALGAVALAAGVAGAAIAGAFLGEVAAASPRAAAALDRMSGAFGKAKGAFFAAFGETIAPLLEKIATLMEDPRFIEFATTLGVKIGNAVLKVANFFQKRVIPNTIGLIKATKDLVAALKFRLMKTLKDLQPLAKKVWEAFKKGWTIAKNAVVNGVKSLVSTVKIQLTVLASTARGIFESIKSTAASIWSGIQSVISGAIAGAEAVIRSLLSTVSSLMTALAVRLEAPWTAMSKFVVGVWKTVKKNVADGINFVIDIMNGLIEGYNKTLAKLPGASKLNPIPPVSLAKGGIVKSPLLAVVGDAPRSPEVVAPLDKLATMLRDMAGGGLGGMTVNITVTVAPGGFATPEAAGVGVADSFVQAMRSRGIKLRT